MNLFKWFYLDVLRTISDDKDHNFLGHGSLDSFQSVFLDGGFALGIGVACSGTFPGFLTNHFQDWSSSISSFDNIAFDGLGSSSSPVFGTGEPVEFLKVSCLLVASVSRAVSTGILVTVGLISSTHVCAVRWLSCTSIASWKVQLLEASIATCVPTGISSSVS